MKREITIPMVINISRTNTWRILLFMLALEIIFIGSTIRNVYLICKNGWEGSF